MLVEFSQGIYYRDTAPFAIMTNMGVDLNIPKSPTIVLFSHGKSEYMLTEDKTIKNAWAGPFPRRQTAWLYWDINLTSGKRTFGYTTIDPFNGKGYGNTLPISPINGQHFFLLTENKMKHYTHGNWGTVIRVFAGYIKDNSRLVLFESGPQGGRNVRTSAGHILFNSSDIPIKKYGEFNQTEFFTTETPFSTQNDPFNTYTVESYQISVRAMEPVPKYHCVSFKGDKHYGIASNLDLFQSCIGIAITDFVKNKIGKIATHGVIQNTDFWNFKAPYGLPVWVGDIGEVTDIVPQNRSLQCIGYTINSSTIFLNLTNPIRLIQRDDECFL